MTTTKSEFSPQRYARAGGLAYLIIIVVGFIDEMFIRNRLIVHGDPMGTARKIVAHPLRWRIGIAGDLTMHVCDVVVAVVFYVLLRRVNRNLALIALFFGFIQTAVLVANKMSLVLALLLLGNSIYLKSLDPQLMQALSYLSVVAHGYGFGVGLIFFGCACLVNGWLIFKSGYFPPVLGVMIQIAGVCYLLNSFALILWPALANALFPEILLPALIGELSMCLWLLFKGVNLNKWNERVAQLP